MTLQPEPLLNRSLLLAGTVAALVIAACAPDKSKSTDTTAANTNSGVALTGAGATFPYPLYSRWFADYATKTGVKINYQSIGSGGGIRQLSEQTVDFGASDAPMSDSDMTKAKGGAILHIPMTLGAVVITYNAPELTQPLKLDGPTLADIFLGRITKWNDPRLASLNAGAKLPARDIIVVHRSDGSGTTYIFSDYLSAVSPSWAKTPGKGKELQWPVGLGAKGNEGVAGQVKQTVGAIAYTELAYATTNKLATAELKNATGAYVAPSIDAVTAAAAGAAAKLPANTDYRISIVNAPGAGSYPISSFTWILLYQNQPDATKGRQLVAFIHWALHEGAPQAKALLYAPVPDAMLPALDAKLQGVQLGAK